MYQHWCAYIDVYMHGIIHILLLTLSNFALVEKKNKNAHVVKYQIFSKISTNEPIILYILEQKQATSINPSTNR